MQSKPTLTMDDVKKIAPAAEEEEKSNNWTVTISIADDGGHLLWLQRLGGAAPISELIAPAKASTAAVDRKETKVFEDMRNIGRYAFIIAPDIDGMVEGGVQMSKA